MEALKYPLNYFRNAQRKLTHARPSKLLHNPTPATNVLSHGVYKIKGNVPLTSVLGRVGRVGLDSGYHAVTILA